MAKKIVIQLYFIIVLIITRLITTLAKLKSWPNSLPHEILSLDISTRFHVDSQSIKTASTDFGNITQTTPSAVLHPSSTQDIIDLIRFSYNRSDPFGIVARGHGHSVRGQAMVSNGVVVDMEFLAKYRGQSGIRVSWSPLLGFYADVGGEQLWIDVLRTTMESGLSPVSWTDYLYLTVGGTLSNAGISGQTFKHGPQISNVLEMDVITGKGESVTCSKNMNSELFYAVLGGLGQFGIITRARIVLQKAPTRAKWIRMLYNDFSAFTRDQEHLISIDGPDYLEGSLMMHQTPVNNWRSSFFTKQDQTRVYSLLTKVGIIYCLEVVKYYDDQIVDTIDEEIQMMVKGMSYIPGFMFKRETSYFDFLNRVRSAELKQQQLKPQLEEVLHPWLNLFVPKSQIMDFNDAVFKDILHTRNLSNGLILLYPTLKTKWDDRMSAVIPEEDTFYCVGFLQTGGAHDWTALDDQNDDILRYCDEAGHTIKQYLPHYTTKSDWMNHFGSKWSIFQERKTRFDPKMILSPGQRIFNSL